MKIYEISREEFDSLKIDKTGALPEKSWFKSTELKIAGTVIEDSIDKDWGYVILAEEEDGIYRYAHGEVSLASQEEAETKIYAEMLNLTQKGSYQEELYINSAEEPSNDSIAVITTIDAQIKN